MTVLDPIGIAAAAEPSGLASRVAVAGMWVSPWKLVNVNRGIVERGKS